MRSVTESLLPPGEGWLGPRERDVLAALATARRRRDWLVGRLAAKRAAAALARAPAERIEVLPAADGAPEVWLDGERLPLSLSLSHRHGRGLAVAGPPDVRVGCDIERVEPRSETLARRLGLAGADDERVTLAWAAREATAKAQREQVRLDTRIWPGRWWREGDFVAVVVCGPPASPAERRD